MTGKDYIKYSGILILLVCLCSCGYKHSGQFKGEYLYLDNEKYIETNGIYNETNNILCTADGFTIYEIAEDTEHNYVAIRSFTDNYLYVKENFVPERKTIIGISFDNNPYNYIHDETLIKTMTDILSSPINITANKEEMFNICRQEGLGVYTKYANDPVGLFFGYIIDYNGNCILIRSLSDDSAFIIPDEQKNIIADYSPLL